MKKMVFFSCLLLFSLIIAFLFSDDPPSRGTDDNPLETSVPGLPETPVDMALTDAPRKGSMATETESQRKMPESNNVESTYPKHLLEMLSQSANHRLPYRMAMRYLQKEDLPKLHAMLNDEALACHWSRIAAAIAYLRDPASFPVLVDYILRWDDPALASQEIPPLQFTFGKIEAVRLLGLLDSPEVEAFLLEMITESGAKKLLFEHAGASLHEAFHDRFSVQVDCFRGRAATGLVILGKPENIARVEEEFNAIHQMIKNDPIYAIGQKGQRGRAVSWEEWNVWNGRHSEFACAMEYRDAIEAEGIERFLDALGTEYQAYFIEPYCERYFWPVEYE
jgi:hypothetical protein